MATSRTVHTAWARHIAQLLEARGKPSGLILKGLGLDPVKLAAGGGHVPFVRQAALFEAAASHLGDSSFGLHFGSGVAPLDPEVLGYAGTGARSLEEGLGALLAYLRTSRDGLLAKLALDGERAFLTVQIADPQTPSQRQIQEFGPVLLMSYLRLLAGCCVTPAWVGFRSNRTEGLDGFERFFGCPVSFGRPKSLIVLQRKTLALPAKPPDARLLQILWAYCEGLLDRRDGGASLAAQVAYLAASRLHGGAPTSQLSARALGLSERTMARRLSGLGTSYGQVLEEVRLKLALRFLEDPKVRSSQIAFLLGYAEPSAFNHAFRRWTGRSPTGYLAGG